jgi:hypothetical protein
MRSMWEKGDFVYFSSHNFLLRTLCPLWLKETAKETIRRSSLHLRAGNVSARSWRERVTTEHTGHTEKKRKRREAG